MESTIDSFKEKIKNPFFGTLLIVWLIFNREFIYNLFFNENYNSEKTLVLLKEQFSGWTPLINLLTTICLTLLLLALIYLALNLSRFIVEFSERIVQPKVLKIFSSNSIVTREVFDRVEAERDYFQKKYSEERTEKLKLQREFDEAKTNSNNNIENKIIDGGIINENESNSGYSRMANLISESEDLRTAFNSLIRLTNLGKDSVQVSNRIGSELVSSLLEKNLIQLTNDSNYTNPFYTFTSFGEKVRDHYLDYFS